jgi:hypothetical protein
VKTTGYFAALDELGPSRLSACAGFESKAVAAEFAKQVLTAEAFHTSWDKVFDAVECRLERL